MSSSDQRIRWVVSHMLRTLEEWPSMTWEDALAINRTMGWGYRAYRAGFYDMTPASVWVGRLSKADLRKAWDLAQEMSRDNLALERAM